MNVKSIITIGGFGGIAIGLAGRQLAESFFAGLMMFTSSPFEKEELVTFEAHGSEVTGDVVDIGMFKTTIRAENREVFTIPNSVFFSTVVLNKTRKYREYRMLKSIHVRPVDETISNPAQPVLAAVEVIRERVLSDTRLIAGLPNRVHLRGIDIHGFKVTIQAFVNADSLTEFYDAQEELLAFAATTFSEHGVVSVIVTHHTADVEESH